MALRTMFGSNVRLEVKRTYPSGTAYITMSLIKMGDRLYGSFYESIPYTLEETYVNGQECDSSSSR